MIRNPVAVAVCVLSVGRIWPYGAGADGVAWRCFSSWSVRLAAYGTLGMLDARSSRHHSVHDDSHAGRGYSLYDATVTGPKLSRARARELERQLKEEPSQPLR